jgi:hypothetical protein
MIQSALGMKTTFEIDPALLARAEREVVRQGCMLSEPVQVAVSLLHQRTVS